VTRVVVLALALAACDGPTISGTTCNDDKDCNLFNTQGTCEATGFCSFPDIACPSGKRYGPGEGTMSDTCVDGAATCGNKGQACCGSGVCAANLACVAATAESATCECGAAGEPCCDGTTCDSGLRCGASATCSSSEVLQVAAGAGHACVLFGDHTVSCWGHDWKPYPGYPGRGDAVMAYSTPTAIEGATDIQDLRAGEFHTCGTKSDKTLWCWGHNDNGQLGNGTTTHSTRAVQVTGLTNVTLFDAGRLHTCAVASNNGTAGLWCWGRGGNGAPHSATQTTGRLGNGSSADSSVPVKVDLSQAAAAGQTIKSLSVGGYHTCIVMSDSKVWCWGRNTNGELGNTTTTPSTVPVLVSLGGITIPANVTVDEVKTSDGRRKEDSTCIRLSDGTTYCWGANARGELGDGTTSTTARTAPTTAVDTSVLGGAKFVQLASAMWAKCARTDTGDVWCWGRNKNGIVGINDGNLTNVTRPTKALNLAGITQLEMSHMLACAVDGNHQLFCWGTNHRGQAKAKPPADATDAVVVQPTKIAF
jgi:alpha-tubulin suppressor-like RCC1 family protein